MYPIWYINTSFSVLLQFLLFWRGYRTGLWRHYPLFYAYLTYTGLWSLVCSFPAVTHHPAYAVIYWSSYLTAAFLRFGIMAEVLRHVFPRGSALRDRVNLILLVSLALLALLFWFSDLRPEASVLLDSARKIALTVAVWDLLVLGQAQYYQVPIGRNLWGMALGLLTFTGTEFVHLAAMDLVPRFRVVLGYVHPLAFVAMLLVWTYALWGYYPNPRPALDDAVGRRFLSAWQDRWAELPHLLRKVVKP